MLKLCLAAEDNKKAFYWPNEKNHIKILVAIRPVVCKEKE
jgi:hypothetical protein